MVMSAVACEHANIVTVNDDRVCSTCGTVLGEMTFGTQPEGKSITNLYERHSIGSRDIVPKTEDTKIIRKYFHNKVPDKKSQREQEYLSKFSNSCQKLMLNKMESEYALTLFKRGKKEKKPRQYPMVAVWAIYKTCRRSGNPKFDEEVKRAVGFEFHRKKLPHMAKILYLMMSVIVPEDDDADENARMYNFRIMIRKLLGNSEYEESEYTRMYNYAWELYTKRYFGEQSNHTAARLAITEAFGLRRK